MSTFTAHFLALVRILVLGCVFYFFLPVFFDGLCFPLPFFQLSCLLCHTLKPFHDTKAPGDDRKALTIPLPQMRSTTQARAFLNTNAPNLPQLFTAPGLNPGLGLIRWSPCAQNPAEIQGMKTVREKLFTIGPITARRLHGK